MESCEEAWDTRDAESGPLRPMKKGMSTDGSNAPSVPCLGSGTMRGPRFRAETRHTPCWGNTFQASTASEVVTCMPGYTLVEYCFSLGTSVEP